MFTDSFLKAVSGKAESSNHDFSPDGVISLKETMEYIGKRIDHESIRNKKFGRKPIKMSPKISMLRYSEGEFYFIPNNSTLKNCTTVTIQDTEKNTDSISSKGKIALMHPDSLKRNFINDTIKFIPPDILFNDNEEKTRKRLENEMRLIRERYKSEGKYSDKELKTIEESEKAFKELRKSIEEQEEQ